MKLALWAVSMTALVAAATAAAAPADQIQRRIAAYRALGAAFKTANDTVRSGDFRSARLQQAADRITAAAREQHRWFAAGTGPRPGVKTAARPEIWTRANEFRAAQAGFAGQAQAFDRAVKTGNGTAIRSEARKLGAQCKGCHDRFRESDN
jgi:cytochrome c556